MSVLVLRTPCPHGIVPSDDFPHYECGGTHVTSKHFDEGLCPGGSEVVLDPTTVLDIDPFEVFTAGDGMPGMRTRSLTVGDVIQALQGDET